MAATIEGAGEILEWCKRRVRNIEIDGEQERRRAELAVGSKDEIAQVFDHERIARRATTATRKWADKRRVNRWRRVDWTTRIDFNVRVDCERGVGRRDRRPIGHRDDGV